MATLTKPEPSSDALSRLQIRRPTNPRGRSWLSRLVRFATGAGVLLGVLAGVVFLATRLGWISPTVFSVPEVMQARPQVRLATVSVETGRSGDATVVATGYLESQRQAKIGARAPGRIELVNVEEGSKVKEGEILAVLEHADLDASLAAAEASLARAEAAIAEHEVTILSAQRDSERGERLWQSKSIAESEYDAARFRYQEAIARRSSLAAEKALAQARVREAQQMKENMFIRAPFDGTVISKDAEVGESILPGGMGEASGRGSAVTVADLNHLDVDCDVKEDYISRVSIDQLTEVSVDAVPDFRYQGRVRKIIPMGDRARATIKVKVEIINADERLFPEMSATVYFLPTAATAAKGDEKRIFCETAAIVTEAEDSFVWVVDAQNRVRRQPVQTGTARDGRTEILEGLSGDERVIVPTPEVRAEQLVHIVS